MAFSIKQDMRAGRGRILFAVIFLVVTTLANAQDFPQEYWYNGHVTLTNGVKKEGQIKYDLDANAIQLQADNKVEAFSASQFYTFSIFVEDQQAYRNFYVIPFTNETNYKRPTIFELIKEGQVSLLAREYIATRNETVNNSFYRAGFGGWNPYGSPFDTGFRTQYLAFKLFLVDKKGNIAALSSNKKDVIATFTRHQKEVKKFIKQEKIKTDRVMDVARLVDYYNSLDS